MSGVKRQSSPSLFLVSLFLGSALGILSDSACADPTGVDMGPSHYLGEGGGGNSPGNYTPPTRDYAAEARQQEADAAAARQRQTLTEATAANEQGVQFYKNSDWAKAVAAFQEAADKNPNETVIKQNLANAQANLRNQQAEILAKQQAKESAARMHKSIENLAESLTVAPTTSGGLDFDGGNAPAARGGGSGGLDFTAAIATPSSPLEFGDPKVVDTRNVPSGLPKSVEATIPHTPAGDRVRKGFQAIADHDWKVALAWFQDALNKEPGDPGLQRLVDLAQFTLQRGSEPAAKPVDAATAVTMDKIGKIIETGMDEELSRSLNNYNESHPVEWLKAGNPTIQRAPGMKLPSNTELKEIERWSNEPEPGHWWKQIFRMLPPPGEPTGPKGNFGTGIRG